MAIDGPRNPNNWCPVCDGFGGWDYDTSKPRFRKPDDNTEHNRRSYTACLWCGQGNVVRRVK